MVSTYAHGKINLDKTLNGRAWVEDRANVLETIDRSQFASGENPVLRGDVASLRHDLRQLWGNLGINVRKDTNVESKIDDIVRRFNEINRPSAPPTNPVPVPPAPPANPDPVPTPPARDPNEPSPQPSSPSGDDEPPAWFSNYTERFGATDSDGRPTKAAAQSALDDTNSRVNRLEQSVNALNENVGHVDEDGSFVFVDSHRSNDDFDWTTFGLSVGAGILAGILFGLLFLFVIPGEGFFGPIGGIFIGVVLGAVVGLWLANRKN